PQLMMLLRELSQGLVREGDYPNGGSVAAKGWINDEGPFAFLLRTEAVEAPGATHDFTDAPESVEDIAGGLLGGNYLRLVERFRARTVPCIVTFRAPGAAYYVARALWYVYL